MYRTPSKPPETPMTQPSLRWPITLSASTAVLVYATAALSELGLESFAIASGLLAGAMTIGVIVIWIWYTTQRD